MAKPLPKRQRPGSIVVANLRAALLIAASGEPSERAGLSKTQLERQWQEFTVVGVRNTEMKRRFLRLLPIALGAIVVANLVVALLILISRGASGPRWLFGRAPGWLGAEVKTKIEAFVEALPFFQADEPHILRMEEFSTPAALKGKIVLGQKGEQAGSMTLYAISPDGTGLTEIMSLVLENWKEDADVPLSVSADGRTIAIVDGRWVHLITAWGDGNWAHRQDTVRLPKQRFSRAYLSPDGTRMLFARGCNLYTVAFDGARMEQLTYDGYRVWGSSDDPVCDVQYHPIAWLSHGTEIALVRTWYQPSLKELGGMCPYDHREGCRGHQALEIASDYGSNRRQADLGGIELVPPGTTGPYPPESTIEASDIAWSSDATKVAFWCGDYNKDERSLCVADWPPSETTAFRTVWGPYDGPLGSIVWSPSGTEVAITIDGRVHTIDVRSGALTRLTENDPSVPLYPIAWLP